MKKAAVFVILAISIVALGASVRFDGMFDADYFVLDATPASDIHFYGVQIDVLLISPGNVQMGFGFGYSVVEGGEKFFGRTVDHTVDFYSVASYRTELSSVLDILIVSRGGISVPNHDFSLSGYFVEVTAEIAYFMGSFHIFGGVSMKSYAFPDSSVTFIPIKVGVGGEY